MGISDMKLFCNSLYVWNFKESEVIIGKYHYYGKIIKFFKEIYYFFLEGRTRKEFCREFDNISYQTKNSLVDSFLERNILTYYLNDITDIFYKQECIYNNNFNKKNFEDVFQQQKYLMEESQNRIATMNLSKEYINLDITGNNNKFLYNRRTIRNFNADKKISRIQLSKLLDVLMIKEDNGINKGNYPSAGALYPLDIYLYIKENRVENIPGGIYYLDVFKNRLVLVNDKCKITPEVHFGNNKNVFENSAISIYVIYNGNVSMPKYGGRAYFYAIVEAGIILECLSLIAEEEGMGSCIIGDMMFSKIEELFHLRNNCKWIISMELGLK